MASTPAPNDPNIDALPLRLAVIIGSTREGRFGPKVARWFAGEARRRDDLDVEMIDVVDLDLSVTYPSQPSVDVEALTARIGAADAFVVVTPEYNHSFPAGLKQAIDLVRTGWQAKPVGFVSYGGMAGGLRAVEALRLVFAELHAHTLRDTVSFSQHWQRFDQDGRPLDVEGTTQAAKVLLEHLTWWAQALRTARQSTKTPF